MPTTSPHIDALLQSMERYWGYDSFRPLQQEAMSSVMDGRDSVVVLPTGGGKSLCFQAPAATMGGMALVVSPLISLMKDQVDTLRNCGIEAAYLNSSLTPDEYKSVYQQIRKDELKLLYIAPERLLLNGTLAMLAEANVSLAAIDEAHCISSWGHDFRPEYRALSRLKEVFPNIGIHAYTATATEAVREDIAKQLKLETPEMLVGSFDRPNLTYRVRVADKRLNQIKEIIVQNEKPDGTSESGIVYCISKKEVDRTAEKLKEAGYRAAPYHAGLSDIERKRNQDDFLNDRVDIVVATVAFGMGIDKPNVRFVIHSGMPKSLESYQQEAGRAGRDGLAAECVLLYSRGDFGTWKRMLEGSAYEGVGDGSSEAALEGAMQALNGMSRYATSVTCRHQALVSHFGQDFENIPCGACDVCLGELDLVDDPLLLAQKIISCVARLDQRYGADHTCKVLLGSTEERILQQGHDQLSTYGLLKENRLGDVRDWVEQLIGQGYLERVGEYNILHISESGRELLKGNAEPMLSKVAKKNVDKKGKSRRTGDDWEGVDRGLFERLRTLRSQVAAENGVPAYIVFGDASLKDLARRRPSTLETFRQAHGVGEKKLREYGEMFLEVIGDYCTENSVTVDTVAESETPKPKTYRRIDAPNRSAQSAFPHFREGMSIAEVAKRLGRAKSTTTGYLSEYLKHETVTDPTPWVDSATVSLVEEAIESVGLSGLKPIHEYLGGEIDYEAIRIVATCVGNRE